MFRKSIIIVAAILYVSGCSNEQKTAESRLALIKTTNPQPLLLDEKKEKRKDLAPKVKKEIEAIKEVYDVAVVVGEKEVLVAYKVKHLQRFHMKKIEKAINKRLEEKFPKEDFIVSSDYKIFLEAVELKEQLKDPDFTRKKANDKLKEIINMKKELT
ncbi:YhcN/YlaJ family sporulation lipoprotein [Bacillus infantis]|uniref:YhcN/YlaJ family sporulation lipoprotein n=1 Tax=Bacillus infantis TaxID=324767 RepID=UPI001CD5797C|nr:YhcN/YlaJ family sporulation lipoprotein [Bacillus infantis]MCA1039557.1 YhcN/YlaJ family sporulation lipoprotein [Bacillus infantis]